MKTKQNKTVTKSVKYVPRLSRKEFLDLPYKAEQDFMSIS